MNGILKLQLKTIRPENLQHIIAFFVDLLFEMNVTTIGENI